MASSKPDPEIPACWRAVWGQLPDGEEDGAYTFPDLLAALMWAAAKNPARIKVQYQGTEFYATGTGAAA